MLMPDSLLYMAGVFCLIYCGKFFLRRICLWAMKFFGIFLLLLATANAQGDPPPPTPTDSENLAMIANGAQACAFGLGIITGLLAWQALGQRTRFDV